MFSNCGEFVTKISISLSIMNDVSYIEQRDMCVF